VSAYGIAPLSDESLNGYAWSYLKEENNVRQTAQILIMGKVINTIMEEVHPKIKEVSREEYNKIINPEIEEKTE
jgi:hypothetical protein